MLTPLPRFQGGHRSFSSTWTTYIRHKRVRRTPVTWTEWRHGSVKQSAWIPRIVVPLSTRPDRYWDTPSLLSNKWVPGVKWLKREADLSSLTCADVKNSCSFNTAPPIRLHDVVLRHRGTVCLLNPGSEPQDTTDGS